MNYSTFATAAPAIPTADTLTDALRRSGKARICRFRKGTEAQSLKLNPAHSAWVAEVPMVPQSHFFAPEPPAAEDGPCLVWLGPLHQFGYPITTGQDAPYTSVANVAWSAWHGQPFPRGRVFGHRCARRDCVSPLHGRPVTDSQNIAESLARRWSRPMLALAPERRCPHCNSVAPASLAIFRGRWGFQWYCNNIGVHRDWGTRNVITDPNTLAELSALADDLEAARAAHAAGTGPAARNLGWL